MATRLWQLDPTWRKSRSKKFLKRQMNRYERRNWMVRRRFKGYES